ncbi:MAG: hypothetical protein HQL70_04320 [Magnetococcales bacterium]|nr:hypothetical protein [Magnetococcales bacterium]
MSDLRNAWSNCSYAPEKMLWSAVLETALNDALTHRDPVERERAIRWFRDGGQHFKMVCDMANYDPNFVQTRVLLMVEANNSDDLVH